MFQGKGYFVLELYLLHFYKLNVFIPPESCVEAQCGCISKEGF